MQIEATKYGLEKSEDHQRRLIMLDFTRAEWFLGLQWMYAMFQAVRNTKGFNLVSYFLQWILFRDKSKTKIIWVNRFYKSKTFNDISGWFEDDCNAWPRRNLLNRQRNGVEFLDHKLYWYKIKYNGKYYWVHQDTIGQLYHYDLSNCYFIVDLYDLNHRFSVGQSISEKMALLLLFNMDMHFMDMSLTTKTVIHGKEFNIEFNSKLGGFLATIPLILQAWNMNTSSAIATIVLLFIDFLRTPLYRSYEKTFFELIKLVKLYIFKKNSWAYDLFGIFSDKWKYSNYESRYAYLTHADEEVQVTSYVSFLEENDCDLRMLQEYKIDLGMPNFIIRDGVISRGNYNYGENTAIFRVRDGLYFS